MKHFILCLFAISILTLIAVGDDKLVSVDPASGLVTIDQRGALKSFRAKQFTEITVNGAKATIQQLRPGMMLNVVLSDGQTLAKITARGNLAQIPATPAPAANPAPPAAPASIPIATPPTTPKALNSPAGTARRITIELYVDGGDVVKIGNGRLWIEHASAKKPNAISINGLKWEPTWSGNTSEPFTAFVPGLAPFTSPQVSVKQTKGRGQTTVLQPPTSENQQTLSFRVQDGGSGGDKHEVRVTW